jgi:hypothetical protein
MGRKLIVASFTFSLFVFAWASPSTAEVILEVDVSDPNAAVFTSTGAFADNTVLNVNSVQGIFLEDFFSGNSGGGTDPGVAGALNVFDSTAGTTRSPLDAFFCCGGAFFFGPDDLNIYGLSGNFPMSFLDTEPAMTGSLTVDLIQPGDPVTGLPAPGVVGDVYAGGQDSSNIIGQWEVVPEAANGTVVTWSFQGNAYSGAIIGDLSGEVTITLDDEETPGRSISILPSTATPRSSRWLRRLAATRTSAERTTKTA